MSLTAGDVINFARDAHPALSETNAPSDVGFRVLSGFQRELYDAVVQRQPAFLSQTLTVSLPLADFYAGLDLATLLPAGWKDILEGSVHFIEQDAGRTARAWYIAWEQRDMRQRFPAFTLSNEKITLLGTPNDWLPIDTLWITYTAIPTDIVDETSLLALPDDAREPLAAMLAGFFCARLVGQPQFNIDAATANQKVGYGNAKRDLWLNRIWNLGTRQSYRVRDVR